MQFFCQILVESFKSIGIILMEKLVYFFVDHELLMISFQKKVKLSLKIIFAAKSQFIVSNLFRCLFCGFPPVSKLFMTVKGVLQDGKNGGFE